MASFGYTVLGFGGGGPSFSPSDLANLWGWYDSSVLSSLWQDDGRTTAVTSDGDPVGAWDDLSGNGRHALQSSAGGKPTYKTTVGGNATSLSFDGGDWLDATSNDPDWAPMTLIAVLQATSGDTGRPCCFVNSTVDNVYITLLLRGTPKGAGAFDARASGSQSIDTDPNEYDDDANHVLIGVSQGDSSASDDRELWVDGGDYQQGIVSVDYSGISTDLMSIGRLSRATPASYWDRYLMEIIIYTQALSTANRQAVENYLITKWSI
jgi:hypothetical protein